MAKGKPFPFASKNKGKPAQPPIPKGGAAPVPFKKGGKVGK